jgi:membrane protein DedA with SNARE-associated domain
MGYLQWLMPYLERYSYAAIFISCLLDGMIIPAPSQLLLISAGLMAAHGKMNLYLMLFTAWSGALIGSLLGYLLGYSAGRQWLLHYGRRLRIINETRFSHIEYYFNHYGGRLIIIARFVDPLRQLISFIAGTVKMPIRHFISYSIIGATLWVGIWGIGSYFLGEHVKKAEPYVIAIGVCILLVTIWYLLRRQH